MSSNNQNTNSGQRNVGTLNKEQFLLKMWLLYFQHLMKYYGTTRLKNTLYTI